MCRQTRTGCPSPLFHVKHLSRAAHDEHLFMSHSLAVTDLAPASPAEWFISCQRPGAACRLSGPDGSHAAVLHAALSNRKHHRPAFSRSRGKSQAAITAAVGAAPARRRRHPSGNRGPRADVHKPRPNCICVTHGALQRRSARAHGKPHTSNDPGRSRRGFDPTAR